MPLSISLSPWQALVVLLLAALPLAAGPTLDNPDAPLEIRPEKEVEQLLALAQQLHQDATNGVKVYNKKRMDNLLQQVKPLEIGRTHGTIEQLRRAANRLKIWGEAAGVDYFHRAERLDADLQLVINTYKLIPGWVEQSKTANSAAIRVAQQRQGELSPQGTITKLVNKQSWELAETAIHDAIDEVDAIAVWLEFGLRQERLKPFLAALQIVAPQAEAIKRARAQDALGNAFRDVAPRYDQFQLDLAKAASDLKAKPEALLAGQQLAGPDLVAAAIARFRALHWAALKARGLAWARGLDERPDSASDLDKLLLAQAKAAQAFPAALAALVDADASRATAEQTQDLYQKHLAALAPFAAAQPDDTLAKALAVPLEKLAAKSPAFASEVAAYRKATSELLRWRSLAAQSAAKRKKAGFGALHPLVLDAARASSGYGGLVTADTQTTADLALLGPAGEFLRKAQTKLGQQNVLLTSGIGAASLPGLSGACVLGRYELRVASQTPLAAPPAEIERLKADLFVTAMTPALSLEAAAAVAGAERGDVEEWGVAVSGCELRPLVTGWATLAEPAAAWWPTRPFIRERGDASTGPVVVVVTGDLKWARGRYLYWDAKP